MGMYPMNEIIKKITKHFCFGTIKCLEFIKSSYIYRFGKIQYLKIERSYLKNTNENTNRKFLLRGIAALFILSIFVMLFPPVKFIFMYLTGTKTKLALLEFIGLGISGIIALFGVGGLLQRATALDKQNKISEEGQVQERFKTATEHLGSEHASVRIAAFNEFCHLVEIKPDLRKTIFDILCGHLRQTTTDKNYQTKEEYPDTAESKKIKPSVEMHDLLDILFKPGKKDDLIFGGLNANLRGANLQGASLQEVDLIEADMYNANLQEAYLEKINLQKAYLYRADLKKANLKKANLQEARMWRANLQNANLQMANLQMVDLRLADLRMADLRQANLCEAEINKDTKMPDGWKNMVKKDANGKTGVLVVDDKRKIIERL